MFVIVRYFFFARSGGTHFRALVEAGLVFPFFTAFFFFVVESWPCRPPFVIGLLRRRFASLK
jgi:hypothetical protein